MRANKLLKEVKHLSYVERLKYLYNPTLQYRRFRGDMIKVYELLSGIYDSNIACQLVKPTNFVDYSKDTFIMIYVNINLVIAFDISHWNRCQIT